MMREQYEDQGYFVIQNVYSPQEIELMKKGMEHLWLNHVSESKITPNDSEPLASIFPPLHEVHLGDENLIHKYILHSKNFSIADQLFREESLVAGSTCFYKAPGAKSLVFHQDNSGFGPSPGTVCALWISIDPATSDNGCLLIIPKSHNLGMYSLNNQNKLLLDQILVEPESQSVQNLTKLGSFDVKEIHTNPGDVIVFHGDTIHGSASNTTQHHFRRSIAVHMVPASVKKMFANYDSLVDSQKNVIKRKLNKRHSLSLQRGY